MNSDWSQFWPELLAGLVGGLILLALSRYFGFLKSDRVRNWLRRASRNTRTWARRLPDEARASYESLRQSLRRGIAVLTVLTSAVLSLVFLCPDLLTYKGVVSFVFGALLFLAFVSFLAMTHPIGSVFALLIVGVLVVGALLFVRPTSFADADWPSHINLSTVIDFSNTSTIIMATFLITSGLIFLAGAALMDAVRGMQLHGENSLKVLSSLPPLHPILEEREKELLTVVRAEWYAFREDLAESRKPHLAPLLEPYEPKKVESYSLHLGRAKDAQRPTATEEVISILLRRDFLSSQKHIQLAMQKYFDNALITISWHVVDKTEHAELADLREKATLPAQPVATLPPPRESAFPIRKKRTIFHDDFESDMGWEDYLQGAVVCSPEVSYSGNQSLKKHKGTDPHGGFRKLDSSIGTGLVFSGWIFRPPKPWQGVADRLSVEDGDFNGYGFAVVHGSNEVWIERRDNGKASTLTQASFTPPTGQWYHFEFHVKAGGEIELLLGNSSGTALHTIATASDQTYSTFDRIAVHGGSPYYVDELMITRL